MINLRDAIALDMTDSEILELISDRDKLERLYQSDSKRLTELIYKFESLLAECGILRKEKVALEEQVRLDYDKMRLALLMENAELKTRLYDELLRSIDPQPKPILKLFDNPA